LLNSPEFNPALRVPEKRLSDFTRYLNPKTWIPASWKQALKEAVGQETVRVEPAPVSAEAAEERQRLRQVSTATDILLGKVDVESIEWGKVINITVRSPDPQMAARIANEFPEAYIVDQLSQVRGYESQRLADRAAGELKPRSSNPSGRWKLPRRARPGGDHGLTIMDEQVSELEQPADHRAGRAGRGEARLALPAPAGGRRHAETPPR
jgi:hypothetical protein